jgi:hypothetical protein
MVVDGDGSTMVDGDGCGMVDGDDSNISMDNHIPCYHNHFTIVAHHHHDFMVIEQCSSGKNKTRKRYG